MTVEYVGDSIVGGLHCHKLKCSLPPDVRAVPENHFFVWLARDRNLLAVRHEWHEPGWIATLPTGVKYVDDLREIRPGVWFPYRTTMLAFQKFSREGLSENRPLLQWRHDIDVESLETDPDVDGQLFTRLEVPAGTAVQVRDERGKHIGQYKQPQAGNIDPGHEKLITLRQEAQVHGRAPGLFQLKLGRWPRGSRIWSGRSGRLRVLRGDAADRKEEKGKQGAGCALHVFILSSRAGSRLVGRLATSRVCFCLRGQAPVGAMHVPGAGTPKLRLGLETGATCAAQAEGRDAFAATRDRSGLEGHRSTASGAAMSRKARAYRDSW
jgi:hypothetical protein